MSDIPQDSAENTLNQQTSLGTYLREQRQKKGFTLEQVASATRINLKVLQSLELDRFEELPAKPFVRGFIMSYARFVGADGKDILLKWDPYIDAKMAGREDKPTGLSGYAFDRREGGEQSRTYLSVIMAVLVVVGGVGLVIFKSPGRHGKHSQLEQLKATSTKAENSSSQAREGEPAHGTVAAPVEPETKGAEAGPSPVARPLSMKESEIELSTASSGPQAAPQPSVSLVAVSAESSPEPVERVSPTPSPVLSPAASPSPVVQVENPQDPLNSGVGIDRSKVKQRVILKAVADVWVRYRSDDRPHMRFILRKGKVLVLRAEKGLVLQVSNAKALSANVNFGRDRSFAEVPSSGQLPSGTTWVFAESKEKQAVLDSTPFSKEKALPATPDPEVQEAGDSFSQ
jgi:cytoskeleton protein RodZ